LLIGRLIHQTPLDRRLSREDIIQIAPLKQLWRVGMTCIFNIIVRYSCCTFFEDRRHSYISLSISLMPIPDDLE
ncbi:MAG: hypothetical protein WBX81_05425, partial [Nitrososphaeraceae archaeon]